MVHTVACFFGGWNMSLNYLKILKGKESLFTIIQRKSMEVCFSILCTLVRVISSWLCKDLNELIVGNAAVVK